MLVINRITAEIDGAWQSLSKNGDKYAFQDVTVGIKDNFEIDICGEASPISFVKVEFDFELSNDAMILPDQWERAYADSRWHKVGETKKMPWFFMAVDKGVTYGVGVKTQPNTLCCWEYSNGKLTLNIDVRNGSLGLCLNGRTLNACTVLAESYDVDAFEAADLFCKKMCENPRLPKHPVYGGNDWYCNYGANSFEKIVTHAKRIVECSPKGGTKPFMVVDDGWEICHRASRSDDTRLNGGPWRFCNDNFGDMKALADEIEKVGAIPGLWFRPLLTVEKVPDEYVLRLKGIKVTLDPSVPGVLEMVKRDISTFAGWGYKLIKHDFSTYDIFRHWGLDMTDDMIGEELIFADKTKTTAEIIKNFYMTIREAAGDDVMIMGCNTLGHLGAGVFELQRTGDDTSGREWDITRRYGVNTLAFRMMHHNNFYCADADCVGITKAVSWEKNRQWLDVLSKSGTALFVSIADDAYSDEVKADITTAFEKAAVNTKPSRPVDWMEDMTPHVWESEYGTDKYTW